MLEPFLVFLTCEALIMIVVVIGACHSCCHERDAERRQQAAAAGGGEDAGRPQPQVQAQPAAAEVRSYFPFPYAAGPFRPSAGGGVRLGMTPQAQAQAQAQARAQPPAPEVVAQLPHFPYAPSSTERLECAICLERLRRGEPCSEVPECRHVFHRDCVALWIKSNSTCPLCRAQISPWISGSIGAPSNANMV